MSNDNTNVGDGQVDLGEKLAGFDMIDPQKDTYK